ncbi:MAG: hypothetical protein R3C68_02090 [Myxococcota bacterium]
MADTVLQAQWQELRREAGNSTAYAEKLEAMPTLLWALEAVPVQPQRLRRLLDSDSVLIQVMGIRDDCWQWFVWGADGVKHFATAAVRDHRLPTFIEALLNNPQHQVRTVYWDSDDLFEAPIAQLRLGSSALASGLR